MKVQLRSKTDEFCEIRLFNLVINISSIQISN